PVFHVTGDDPEAAVQAARLAAGYRQTFRGDVFIDFVCYRRHGHNELDDPTPTQPVRYEQVRNHPSVVELYTKRLVQAGVVDENQLAQMRKARRAALDGALATARQTMPRQQVFAFGGVWRGLGWAGDDWSADTRAPAAELRAIGEALARRPEDFTPNPRVKKLLEDRRQRVARGEALDWGTAELLAYGSLLLPHGYEGQGSEHSSARLERFLQLCADRNMQVIVPTTPAQIFHALRRQIHRRFRKPLVVMSPKSLLRHPQAVSSLAELTDGGFRTT